MAHPQQMEFIRSVKSFFPKYFKRKIILEIGSLDINGSVRVFFEDCLYIGLDIGPGPGVDIVGTGHEYSAPDEIFDVAISCECFEHNPYWRETFANMTRVVKPGGLVIFTCATTGRAEHGTSACNPLFSPLTVEKGWEYYSNLTEEDFNGAFDLDKRFISLNFSVNPESCDLYFWGLVK